jgi:hypothetical protein
MKCYDECKINKKCCEVKDCRLWIDFPEDLNCTEIAVQKSGEMVLRKVAERLQLTSSRIKQIESKALANVSKTFQKLNIL